MIVWILIAMAVFLVFTDLNIKIPRKRKGNFNIAKLNCYKVIKSVKNKVEKYSCLRKVKNLYTSKLLVISKTNPETNDTIAILMMVGIIAIATIFTTILFLLGIKMWYVLLVIECVSLYLSYCVFAFYLDTKLKKIYIQFPVAIQMFTDIYITSRNIKTALDTVFKDIPPEVGNVFQKLSRELSSGYEYEKNIKDFAKSLGYSWGYAFAEILLMSYKGSGDITEELIFLNELIHDDIRNNQEAKSEMAGNKMMFLALNGTTAIAFGLNIVFNPIAKQLYFYTIQGNNFIMAWILVITLGMAASTILEKA